MKAEEFDEVFDRGGTSPQPSTLLRLGARAGSSGG